MISFGGLGSRRSEIMLLAHRDLQTFRTPPPGSEAAEVFANWSRALILGILVFASLNSSWAQDAGAVTTGKPIDLPRRMTNHVSMELCLPRQQTLHICLSWSRRRRRIRPRKSVGYLFGNVTSQRHSTGNVRPPFLHGLFLTILSLLRRFRHKHWDKFVVLPVTGMILKYSVRPRKNPNQNCPEIRQ